MGEVIFFVIQISLAIMFFMFLAYYAKLHSIFSLLRHKHEDEWKRLGSPTIVLNFSLQNILGFREYLKSCTYMRVEDHEFQKECEDFKLFLRIYYSFFAILFLGLLGLVCYGMYI